MITDIIFIIALWCLKSQIGVALPILGTIAGALKFVFSIVRGVLESNKRIN